VRQRELDRALGAAHRALLDTSALIAYHSTLEPAHPLARHLFARMEDEQDPLVGYFSVVSAAELLIRPYQAGIRELTLMHTFLTGFPNLTVLDMDLTVAAQAATIRAISGIRLPDAIIVASGLLAGCEAIVTNDEQWKRRMESLFGEFTWIHLGDFA
jgi:predicted nucleic acid-binding protein